jgi:Right handed beta helix region
LSNEHREPDTRGRVFPVLLAALAFFGLLGTLPAILPALHLHLYPTAPTTSYGVTLMVAPRNPHSVHVPQVANPVDPASPWATLPTVNQARETATVAAEDKRLRTLLHDSTRIFQPEVIPVRGSLPTLVLTAAQSAYTAQALVQYGALVMLPHNAALLLDNVYVASHATLDLGGPSLHTLYLDSGAGGFASIVGWGGNLSFQGTTAAPMTILGWDQSAGTPAADTGYGRPYIREAGGSMTLTNVRASALGFWSGRTGGIAWTGLTGMPSTGGATSSTFTDNTYGAFVSRGSGVTFRDDLFEFNQLDGMHVHRYSLGTAVISSSAARNGGNGFVVSPAAENTLLDDDISRHNAGNGYFLNGKPLASGASASGGSVAPGANTTVEYSAALDNGKIGILVEGGARAVLKGNQVCAAITAISVRNGSDDAVVTGNTVGCRPRSGFSIGPATPGLVLSGNAVDGARTGFLFRDSGPVQLDKNLVTRATVFGVSARGSSTAVSGVDNTIAGSGFRAIDARALAPAPSLYNTNLAGWTFHAKVTFWTYLQFHPLAALWLGILVTVLLAWALTRTRRRAWHPYPASTRWRGEVETRESALAANEVPMPARESGPYAPVHQARPRLATFVNPADPGIAFTHSGQRPVPAGPGSPAGPGDPARHAARNGRYDAAPAFDYPANRAQPVRPGNPARYREPAGVEGQADQGSVSGPPRWFGPGGYPEPGARGGASPGRGPPRHRADADPDRDGDAARPPWSTAPIPKLDAESRSRHRFDPYAPWPGEGDSP